MKSFFFIFLFESHIYLVYKNAKLNIPSCARLAARSDRRAVGVFGNGPTGVYRGVSFTMKTEFFLIHTWLLLRRDHGHFQYEITFLKIFCHRRVLSLLSKITEKYQFLRML